MKYDHREVSLRFATLRALVRAAMYIDEKATMAQNTLSFIEDLQNQDDTLRTLEFFGRYVNEPEKVHLKVLHKNEWLNIQKVHYIKISEDQNCWIVKATWFGPGIEGCLVMRLSDIKSYEAVHDNKRTSG